MTTEERLERERDRNRRRMAKQRLSESFRASEKAKRKAWYWENRDRSLAKNKAYRTANRERLNEKARKNMVGYFAAHKEERQRYAKEWKSRNMSRMADYYRNKYATDPQYRLGILIRSRLRNALRSAGVGQSAIHYLGCSVPDFMAHLESKFSPGMSWDNHGKWHLDHIRPLASFDLSVPTDVESACHFTNLQPLWAAENLSKGATYARP